MQLWLIPILPLAGFALNGLFGRRLSKAAINAIAVGSVLLSFLWVLKTLNALGAFSGGLPKRLHRTLLHLDPIRLSQYRRRISPSTA